MDTMMRMLKQPSLWCLGVSIVAGTAQAVAFPQRERYSLRCGPGYQSCPRQFECVPRPSYESICRRRSAYPPEPTPDPPYTPPSYESSSTSTGYPPDSTTVYPPGPPTDQPPPYYPGGSSTSYPPSPPTDYPSNPPPGYPQSPPPGYPPNPPPGYPPSQPPGYPPTGNPPDYPPTGNPPDYPPTGNPPDYPPTGNPPDYPPTGNPPDYPPTGNPPDYPPTGNPPDYPPTNPPTGYPPYPPGPGGNNGGGGYTNGTCTRVGGCGGGGGGGGDNGTEPDGKPYYGIEGVKGKVVERLPVDVLRSTKPDTFNMLILALERLMRRNENNDISYYQVSGIHGFPYIPWQYPDSATANPTYGYCTHGSVLFTTWHRPYLLLLEQLMYEEAVRIANRFSGAAKDKYLAACEELRLPYWDWASRDTRSRIPAAMTTQSVRITAPGPDGSETTSEIPNPLYGYRFSNPQPSGSGLEGQTVRSADADVFLEQSYPGRRQSTLDLFAIPNYNDFSSQCEGIHGTVHVLVGEDMGDVSSAAFDPIFWLHHCQVDRLMSMYQATHPDQVLQSGPRSETFALGGEGPDDLSTPLYPFRHADGREWTSDEIKTADSTFKYGYAYPEVPQGRSGEDLRQFTAAAVNRLYGVEIDQSFQGEDSGVPETPTARREWGATVEVNSEEIAGSHRILIYVGPHDKSNPDAAQDLANLVGVAPIFTGPEQEAERQRVINYTVPLTPALVEKNIALRAANVIPTLSEQLYWRVEKVTNDHTTVPVTELKTLKVSVTSTVTEYSENETELLKKTRPLTHYKPTEGKEGGLQPEEPAPVGDRAPANLDVALTGNGTTGGNNTTV
ncbi:MAG: mitochondrial inner membrane protein required for protein import [Watsoniomyces obsoletus]|nr:MAG: mitochondrial inner membrane protein required for protein import [Watsoniomyces obsoletus]